MQTDDLIRSFAHDLAPVPPRMAQRRTLAGACMGAAITFAAIMLTLGFRPDLGLAMRGADFWIKVLYTASLAIGALAATIQLSRPETRRLSGLWLMLIPFALLVGVAGLELVRTPMALWPALLQGQSESQCSVLVLALSVPIFAGLVWAFRRLAPGNTKLTGAMAGIASGSCAATLYGLHCPESAMVFVLVWYTLGIAAAGLFGMLAAPRLLRW